MQYQKYENENYEILKNDKVIIVKDKFNRKYYEVSDMNTFDTVQWIDYKSKVSNVLFIFYIISLLFFIIVNFFISFSITTQSINNYLFFLCFSVIYTIFNVLSHEFSHIIALKVFNRKIDKVGFKMNYIFPSVYVRMNDAYMMTNNEKIIVHSAGIYANVFINSVLLVVAYMYEFDMIFSICQFFTVGIVMNIVPILNSDGYKVMLAVFTYSEKKNKIYNSPIIKVIGYANVLLAIFYLIKLITDIL